MSDLGPIAQALNFDEICEAHRETAFCTNDNRLTDEAWAGLYAMNLVLTRKALTSYIVNRYIPEDVASAVLHEKNILLGDI